MRLPSQKIGNLCIMTYNVLDVYASIVLHAFIAKHLRMCTTPSSSLRTFNNAPNPWKASLLGGFHPPYAQASLMIGGFAHFFMLRMRSNRASKA